MESLGEILPLLNLATRADRAAARTEREIARREGRHGRMAHLDLDDGLALTPDGLQRLTGCHHSTYLSHDWPGLADRPDKPIPTRERGREKEARRALADYEPTWQERVFAEEAQRRRDLTEQVKAAARADAAEFRQASEEAKAHNAQSQTARRIIAFDKQPLRDAIAETGLSSLGDCLNTLGLARPQPDRVVAVLDLIREDDIAPERITSRSPKTARRELISEVDRRRIHLSAVCAAALRIAGDLVGLLPIERLELVAECEMAGLRGATPILQFRLNRAMVEKMAWGSDPVTLLNTLGPRMNWTQARGFSPIALWHGDDAVPLAKSA